MQAAVPDNVVSAFAQVGIHTKLVDRLNPDNQVAYIDPATARVVVDNYGVIALPDDLQTDPSPAVQLKISDLNSQGQSAIAQQLRGELAEIREALAPPAARRLTHNVHSPTGNVPELPEPPGHELTEPPVPPRRLPVPPRRLFGALPRAPSPPTPSLFPTPPAPHSAEQVVSLHQLTLRRRVRSPTGERRLPADPRPGAFLNHWFIFSFFVWKCLKVLLEACLWHVTPKTTRRFALFILTSKG